MATGATSENHPDGSGGHRTIDPARQNVDAIARMETEVRRKRLWYVRVGDAVTRYAGSAQFVAIHVVWFGIWILANTGLLPGVAKFDEFPFGLLTMIVSLEAIFLSIFVLMTQNAMQREADKRAHLDLQVDMLAEQEMTLVLRLLHKVCEKLQIDIEQERREVQDMMKRTDIRHVRRDLEKHLPE